LRRSAKVLTRENYAHVGKLQQETHRTVYRAIVKKKTAVQAYVASAGVGMGAPDVLSAGKFAITATG